MFFLPSIDNVKITPNQDLVRIYGNEQLLVLIGGDFNIIHIREEKNDDNFDGRWTFMFNTIIESLDLLEIEFSGRKFTWANTLPIPTFEKLDRVLASVEWEQKFPLVTVHALSRVISDHTPFWWTRERQRMWGTRVCSLLNQHGFKEKDS